MIKITTINGLHILQIAKLKAASKALPQIQGLECPQQARQSSVSEQLRIVWLAPDKWLVVSNHPIEHQLSTEHFALTDLSHARHVIEIEGDEIFDIIRKGCPANINDFQPNQCLHSNYRGVNFSLEYLANDPKCFRMMVLRSYGDFFQQEIGHCAHQYL